MYLRWDSPADVPLVDLLRDLELAEGRILIVVSEWYFQLGPRTQEEWNAALREVVAPTRPVRRGLRDHGSCRRRPPSSPPWT